MKKIIKGKMYNTDTAKRVAVWENSYISDFNYCSEELYKKRTGEFFLLGEGGAMSKYAEEVGPNSWGYGMEIRPLTEAEARAWVEYHCDAELYIYLFGEPVE